MSYTDKAQAVFNETKNALKTVYDALNRGQQQKILKEDGSKSLV